MWDGMMVMGWLILWYVQHIGILCFLGTLLTKAGARHLRPCGSVKSETESGGYQELWACLVLCRCSAVSGGHRALDTRTLTIRIGSWSPPSCCCSAAVLQSHAVCSAQCPRLQQHGGGRQEDQLEPGQTHVSRAVCLLCFSPNVVKIVATFRWHYLDLVCWWMICEAME